MSMSVCNHYSCMFAFMRACMHLHVYWYVYMRARMQVCMFMRWYARIVFMLVFECIHTSRAYSRQSMCIASFATFATDSRYGLTPCDRPKADTLFLRELAFIRMHEFPLIIIAVTKSALFKMPTRRQLSHVIINDFDAMVRNQGIVALDAVNRRKLYRVYNLVA